MGMMMLMLRVHQQNWTQKTTCAACLLSGGAVPLSESSLVTVVILFCQLHIGNIQAVVLLGFITLRAQSILVRLFILSYYCSQHI